MSNVANINSQNAQLQEAASKSPNDPSSATAGETISSRESGTSAQSRRSLKRMVRRHISNLSIHRSNKWWTFAFYDKRGEKCALFKIESYKIKPILQYLSTDTPSPYYSVHLDGIGLSALGVKKRVKK